MEEITLAQLLRNLEESNASSDERMKKLEEFSIRTTAETKEILKNLAKSQAETSKSIDKLKESQAETSKSIDKLKESQAETKEILKNLMKTVAETSKKVDKLADMYGGVSNNLGRETEQKIFYFLEKDKKIGDIQFDNLKFNVKIDSDIELDGVFFNGEYLGYLEVKRNLREYDIEKYFLDTIPAFDKHFSRSSHKNKKKVYLFGCETVSPKAIKRLKEKNCYLIRPKADSFYITHLKKSSSTLSK